MNAEDPVVGGRNHKAGAAKGILEDSLESRNAKVLRTIRNTARQLAKLVLLDTACACRVELEVDQLVRSIYLSQEDI